MIYTKVIDNLKDKPKEEIIEEYIELLKEKHKLEKELKKYKNSNTPSSANKHLKEDTLRMKAKRGAKRGAPKGHKGATFVWPDVNKVVDLFVNKCDKCNSKNIAPTGYVKKKKVLCIIKPKVIVREYRQQEIRCLDCCTLTLATHKDIPKKGIYDKSILSLVNYYKFKSRLPHNLVVDVMNNIHGVPMTETTSMNITQRVGQELESEYNKIGTEIKQSKVVQGDETSHSVNGVNHWIWVFCNEMLSLFKFKKERGGDIVEETLGEDFQGSLVSDGWQTYKTYSKKHGIKLQRCWAHLRREVKYECKELHPDLYKWCCDIYFMVKKGKMYKHRKKRLDMYEKCKLELARLIAHLQAHQNLRKLATKVKNGEDNWFTCILHPELPMDNNEAERSLRPFVVMRKIIGCLRSELGVRTHEIMMSIISTWQKQNKNVYHSLQQAI